MAALRRIPDDDEAGAGLIGTMLGAVVFLAFMAVAAHALLGLYATSIATAAAWDSVRMVAAAPNGYREPEVEHATRALQERMNGFSNVNAEWQVDEGADSTVLTVSASRPSLLPPGLLGSQRLTTIERTVMMRNERLR